jgi:hypothetical protein
VLESCRRRRLRLRTEEARTCECSARSDLTPLGSNHRAAALINERFAYVLICGIQYSLSIRSYGRPCRVLLLAFVSESK